MGPGEGRMLLLLLTSLFQVLWDATHVDQLAMYEKEGRMGHGTRPRCRSPKKKKVSCSAQNPATTLVVQHS